MLCRIKIIVIIFRTNFSFYIRSKKLSASLDWHITLPKTTSPKKNYSHQIASHCTYYFDVYSGELLQRGVLLPSLRVLGVQPLVLLHLPPQERRQDAERSGSHSLHCTLPLKYQIWNLAIEILKLDVWIMEFWMAEWIGCDFLYFHFGHNSV